MSVCVTVAYVPVCVQVPHSCLQPLLHAMFLRFVCLMTHTDISSNSVRLSSTTTAAAKSIAPTPAAGMHPAAAAVLAFRYGSVLLEVLAGVLGCASHLHNAFGVEVQHLMATPQVSTGRGG